jgi:hemerythrin
MAYKWDSNLETGHEKVDNQHKQLIIAVNNLMNASAQGKGDKAVLETLDFLTGYAVKHFAGEEQLQVDYNYPDYLNHKRLHDEFKVVVGDLTKQVMEKGPTTEMIDIVSSTVGAWLLNHIKGDDFRMAAFIKAADSPSMQK